MIGASSWLNRMDSFTQRRAYANATGLAQGAAMRGALFGADPATDAAGAVFGQGVQSADTLISLTTGLDQARTMIVTARTHALAKQQAERSVDKLA